MCWIATTPARVQTEKKKGEGVSGERGGKGRGEEEEERKGEERRGNERLTISISNPRMFLLDGL